MLPSLTRDRRRAATEMVATYIPELEAVGDPRIAAQAALDLAEEYSVYCSEYRFEWPSGDTRRDPELELFFADLARSAVAGRNIPEHLQPSLASSLAELQSRVLLRPIVTELHRQADELALATTDPEAQYDLFVRRLRSEDGRRRLHDVYPGTCHALQVQTSQALDVVEETLSRTQAARQDLARVLGVDLSANLDQMSISMGDNHNHGRAVSILTFSDGRKVVYKPRPVAIEAALSSFVTWCNNEGITSLPVLQHVNCGDHGFVEFVPGAEAAKGENFYESCGELLALMHVLGGNDIHFENVLPTHDGRAVIIDAETLLRANPSPALSVPADPVLPVAREKMSTSVLSVGILPTRVAGPHANYGALDIGAAGYKSGQRSPFKVLVLVNPGRSDMTVQLRHIRIDQQGPNESLTPVSRDVQHRLIREGTARTLAALGQRSGEVEQVVRGLFQSVSARFVPVPTVFYAQILRMCTHPMALEDPLLRAVLCLRVALLNGGGADAQSSLCRGFIRDQARQLLEWDVPSFRFPVSQTSLFSSDHRCEHEGYFLLPGIDEMSERLANMDAAAVQDQLRLLDLAFVPDFEPGSEITPIELDREVREDSLSERLIGEHLSLLAQSAIIDKTGERPATWIAPLITTEDNLQ